VPGLGCQPQLLFGLAQLLLSPAAVGELAESATDEPNGVEQFFVRELDLAAQKLYDPAGIATHGNGKGESAQQPVRRVSQLCESFLPEIIPGPHGSVLRPGATGQALTTHKASAPARLHKAVGCGIRPVPDYMLGETTWNGMKESWATFFACTGVARMLIRVWLR
jgi:hypothetical protein